MRLVFPNLPPSVVATTLKNANASLVYSFLYKMVEVGLPAPHGSATLSSGRGCWLPALGHSRPPALLLGAGAMAGPGSACKLRSLSVPQPGC